MGPLGKVAVSGSLQAARFISPGHAGGLVTLSNTRGTATLQLSGTAVPGSSRLPAQFAFLLVSATGAYSQLNQGGTIGLKLTATGHLNQGDRGDRPAVFPGFLLGFAI